MAAARVAQSGIQGPLVGGREGVVLEEGRRSSYCNTASLMVDGAGVTVTDVSVVAVRRELVVAERDAIKCTSKTCGDNILL